MNIKCTLLTFGLVVVGMITSAQNNFSFDYDDSGNRIERIIDMTKSASVAGTSGDNEQQELISAINDLTIKIYPNPTTGKIKVAIDSFDENVPGNIQIFDINGKSVLQKKRISTLNTIDITEMKSGIYFLKLVYNGESLQWKIVKQ